MEDPSEEALPGSSVRGGLQALWKYPPQRHLTPQSPHHQRGFILSLPAFWPEASGDESQSCPPLTHTVRMHKEDMELATKEARRSPLSPSRGSPQQTPERSQALADAWQRRPNASAAPGPAPGASGASAMQTAGAVRHTVSPADPIS